jgi:hypothetical protein
MKKLLVLSLLLLMLAASAQEPVIYIEITPSQITLAPGQTATFTAVGYDKRHDKVPFFRPIWVVEGKGKITPDGRYIAGNNVDDMDFVKAINPITKAQQSARVLIRIPKVEKPMPPVHVHPVPPVKPVPPVHVHPVPPVKPVSPVHVHPVPPVKPAPVAPTKPVIIVKPVQPAPVKPMPPVKPAPMPVMPPVHKPVH